MCRVLHAGVPAQRTRAPWVVVLSLLSRILNLQGIRPARRDIRSQYERGLDLFRAMLDRRMVYSCGYWRSADTLDEAQEAKLDLICRKVGLREGRTLLDIGCGWGSLARHAAERYGARVKGVTLSPPDSTYDLRPSHECHAKIS